MTIQIALSWGMYLLVMASGVVMIRWAQSLYKAGSKQYWWILGGLFLLLALPIMLRGETVGFDTHEYTEYYRYYLREGSLDFRDNIEPIYEILVRLSVYVGSPQIVFAVSGAATILFMLAGIWWLRDQMELGLVMFLYLCFFYLQTYNVVRQCFSVAIIFFALRFISERRFILYALFVYVAYLMHSSAIIALLLYPLAAAKLSPRARKLLCILAAGSVLITVSPYLVPLLELVTQISVFSAYKQHLNWGEVNIGSSWLLRGVLIFGAIFLSDSFTTKENTKSPALFATALSLPLLVVNYLIPPIGRAGAYFSIFNIITFASFASRKSEKTFLPKLENTVIVVFALATFLLSLYSDGLELIPYTFFWA